MTFINRDIAFKLLTLHQEVSFTPFVQYLLDHGIKDLSSFMEYTSSFRDKLVLAYVCHETLKQFRLMSPLGALSMSEADSRDCNPAVSLHTGGDCGDL
jgi:hypothetical protein